MIYSHLNIFLYSHVGCEIVEQIFKTVIILVGLVPAQIQVCHMVSCGALLRVISQQ